MEATNLQEMKRERIMLTSRRRLWWVVSILLSFAPSGYSQKIKTQLDSDYDLALLKKFAFAPVNRKDPLAVDPKLAQSIKQDIKTQLQKIGIAEDDIHPDFLVFYSATKQTKTSTYGTFATGVTAYNESWSVEYKVGTLTVHLLDPQSKRPMWQGSATETIYAGKLQKYFPKGVEKIIRAFQKDRRNALKKSRKRYGARLEPTIGLEPMTCRLRIDCSTN